MIYKKFFFLINLIFSILVFSQKITVANYCTIKNVSLNENNTVQLSLEEQKNYVIIKNDFPEGSDKLHEKINIKRYRNFEPIN